MFPRGPVFPRGSIEDWSTEEDFDPPDAEWLDITAIGSEWQIQIDASRHRSRYRSLRKVGDPWKAGDQPK